MAKRLPVEKKEAILKLYFKSISKRSHNTIREFSRLIGKLVATEPGLEYAQLRYKTPERMNYR